MKNVVHLTDCMEFMRELPDNAYDLCIVDPPYGIFSEKKSNNVDWKKPLKSGTGGTWASKYGKRAKEWDIAPTQEYFDELNRISRERIVWGANHFGVVSDNYVIWRKLTISENFSMGMCEFAHVSCGGNPKVFSYAPQDPGRFHPTQKPIALYKWLLQNYAKPGQTIFDSHVGSGSIRIACHDLGFDFEGCEIDEDYWKAQEERYQRHAAQQELFDVGDIQSLAFSKE